MPQNNRVSFLEGERFVFGCSHDEVGEYIVEAWKLPHSLVEVVALHHQPENTRDNPKLVSLVHLSDCLAHGLGCGYSGDYLFPEFDPAALEEFDIQETRIPGMLEEMEQVMDDNRALFSIIE